MPVAASTSKSQAPKAESEDEFDKSALTIPAAAGAVLGGAAGVWAGMSGGLAAGIGAAVIGGVAGAVAGTVVGVVADGAAWLFTGGKHKFGKLTTFLAIGGLVVGGAVAGFGGASLSGFTGAAALGLAGAAMGGITGVALRGLGGAMAEERKAARKLEESLAAIPGKQGEAAQALHKKGWKLARVLEAGPSEEVYVRDPATKEQKVTLERLPLIHGYLEGQLPDDLKKPEMAEKLREALDQGHMIRAKGSWNSPAQSSFGKAANFAEAYERIEKGLPVELLRGELVAGQLDASSPERFGHSLTWLSGLADSFTEVLGSAFQSNQLQDEDSTYQALLPVAARRAAHTDELAEKIGEVAPHYLTLVKGLQQKGDSWQANRTGRDVFPMLEKVYGDDLEASVASFLNLAQSVGTREAGQAMEHLKEFDKDKTYGDRFLRLVQATGECELAARAAGIAGMASPEVAEQHLEALDLLAQAASGQPGYRGILLDYLTVMTHHGDSQPIQELAGEYAGVLSELAGQGRAEEAAQTFVARRLGTSPPDTSELQEKLSAWMDDQTAAQAAGALGGLPGVVRKEHVQALERLALAASNQDRYDGLLMDYATVMAARKRTEPLSQAVEDYSHLLSALAAHGQAGEAGRTYVYIRDGENRDRFPQDRQGSIQRFIEGLTAGADPAAARANLIVSGDIGSGGVEVRDDDVVVGGIKIKKRR